MLDSVLVHAMRAALAHPADPVSDLETEVGFANLDLAGEWADLGLGELGGERLHRQAVVRRRPEIVEALVAASAAHGALVVLRDAFVAATLTGHNRRGNSSEHCN